MQALPEHYPLYRPLLTKAEIPHTGPLLSCTLLTTLTPHFHSVASSEGDLTGAPSGVHTVKVEALKTDPSGQWSLLSAQQNKSPETSHTSFLGKVEDLHLSLTPLSSEACSSTGPFPIIPLQATSDDGCSVSESKNTEPRRWYWEGAVLTMKQTEVSCSGSHPLTTVDPG